MVGRSNTVENSTSNFQKRKETLQTERDVALSPLWPYVEIFVQQQLEGSGLQHEDVVLCSFTPEHFPSEVTLALGDLGIRIQCVDPAKLFTHCASDSPMSPYKRVRNQWRKHLLLFLGHS